MFRFSHFFEQHYGHERISTVLKRDVEVWMKLLGEDEEDEEHPAFVPATVNNHLASLSGFTSWVHAQRPDLFALGNPCSGVKELPLPALVPRTLSEEQVISLKSLLLRLPAKMQCKGLRHVSRRRNLFLGADARAALADYLEFERGADAERYTSAQALFLRASSIKYAKEDEASATGDANGRLTLWAINKLVTKSGVWHDAEQSEHVHTIFVNSAREKTGKLKTLSAPAILAREGFLY